LGNEQTAFRLALAGDAIINRRVSGSADPDLLAILELFQKADLAVANCETLFHDYVGPEIYPALEAGWSYMRAPRHIADELRWMGFRLMGTANNHMLDYAYGGMFSTHAALTEAGIEHAGSGRDLAAARAPAFADAGGLRVGLVSMTTSSTLWSRAGLPHDGIPGRPGVNPLRFHFAADKETMRQVIDLATRFGWWIAHVGDREWELNPPGLHHTITRYFEVDEPGAGMVLDQGDVQANLRSIRNAKAHADIVVVHIHNHEWDQARGTAYPASFLPPFARAAIDAGADVVLAQGSHAPLRGIELHREKPIFYDTGDLFSMSHTITRFPYDFYSRHVAEIRGPLHEALPEDGLAARGRYHTPMTINPPGGYRAGRSRVGIVPMLHFGADGGLARVDLHPFVHRDSTVGGSGVPFRPDPAAARKILDDLATLSEPFGTRIVAGEGGIGVLALRQ